MAKFSVGRLEDGEGPSNRIPKKQRTNPQSEEQEQDDTVDYEIIPAEEDEEEDQEEYEDYEEDEETNGEAVPVGSTTGFISVTLTDPEVFDCPICCEPLSPPVFQCENGHTACSSCCSKLMNKCPSCCLPIGYNRCRAIEKVLESIKVLCQNTEYGCKEKMSYSERHRHLKMCDYAPCSCPLSDCIFVGSSRQLYQHFSAKHEDSAVKFQYNRDFHITLNRNDRFLLLQEETRGVLFVLHNRNESLGHVISLSSIAPSWREGFLYSIQANPGGGFLKFQSNTKSIQNWVDNPPSTGSLLVSPESFSSYGKLKLCICVRGKLYVKLTKIT